MLTLVPPGTRCTGTWGPAMAEEGGVQGTSVTQGTCKYQYLYMHYTVKYMYRVKYLYSVEYLTMYGTCTV